MVHALRPLLTTKLFQRDQLAVATGMEQAFETQAQWGPEAASASERTAVQLKR
jgi:hypothetical protein